MHGLFYLSIFIFRDYNRRFRLIIQFSILVIVIGLFFNYHYAPYSYHYIALGKSIFLMIISLLTTYQLSKSNYNRRLYILLSRVSRKKLSLSLILVAFIIVVFFSIILDLYLLLLAQIESEMLLNPFYLTVNLIIIFLSVITSYLFSYFTIKRELIILSLIFLVLGSIPEWYIISPLTWLLKGISWLFPPLSSNILALINKQGSAGLFIHSVGYGLLALFTALILLKRKSFSDLPTD